MQHENLIKKKKVIHDNIHNSIHLTELACHVIDTPEFQRLRYIYQLGTCYMVFHNATHTRFEHSIGTYYLAGQLLKSIRKYQTDDFQVWLSKIPELQSYYKKYHGGICVLDKYVCELIKIAGLLHDVGHGPFSHVFDDSFLAKTSAKDNKYSKHEERSCLITKHILKDILPKDDIDFIVSVINPTNQVGFVYQIISNNYNNIDVDKFDYITRDSYTLGSYGGFNYLYLISNARVIDNNICYSEEMHYEIFNMFLIRYSLFKQTYCHKTTIAVQIMISEIMFLLDHILNISDSISDVQKFVQLTDTYIINSVPLLIKLYPDDEKVVKANSLYQRIIKHKFYKQIGFKITSKPLGDYVLKDLLQENIIITTHKIGFISKDLNNPLDNIFVYEEIDSNVHCINIKKENVSSLFSENYQEYMTVVYYKTPDDNIGLIKARELCRKILN